MFWADRIAADATAELQVVNDSKTPSGRVHVGSVRGVVIHDTIYRALRRQGKAVKFLYGADDYDAFDSIPSYLDRERFEPYLGMSLCNVPSPGEGASDYAKYFMGEFLEVLAGLGIEPEVYYLRDHYRAGKFDRHIDIFLQNAQLVRDAYKDASKAERPDNWYPFQVVCENCGKIATTAVTDYNGSEVYYECKPEATDYTQGCGHSGWRSPFGGNGKLPWKVEWVAKWDLWGVTIELAGKDHSQKGGSRDVANAICRKVLRKQPPFHSPYEFILVNGTKMSSSKGVGSSARDMSQLLPPEILRFLMLRTRPKSAINFMPNYETIVRLFRDYDGLVEQYMEAMQANAIPSDTSGEFPEDLLSLLYSQLDESVRTYHPFDFSTVVSLLQIPHLDIRQEIATRSTLAPDESDRAENERRIAVAQKWLDDYADEEEKLVIYFDSIPDRAKALSEEQVNYLSKLVANLDTATWEGETLQTTIFTTTKEIDMKPGKAFPAVYLSFLNKERGPRAGAFLSYLDREFAIARLQAVIAANTDDDN
ncbi:MAG: lysine--tRNA ligase [Cyanobacteria bacterium J06641_5]